MSHGSSRRLPVVAHFVPFYLPRTETFIYQVLTHHRRYKPIVLAQRRVDTAELFPFPEVYSYEDLKRRWTHQAWYERIQHYLFGRSFERYEGILARRRATLLHVHFGHTGAELISLSRLRGIPQVTSFYGWDDTIPVNQERWKPRFERLFREGDAFLVEGSHIASRLTALGCPADKIRIHRIGIDLTRIPVRPPTAPNPGTPVRILFCGRLVEKKGLRDAVQAVSMATSAGLDIEFHVIGSGPLRPEIEAQVRKLGLAERVVFQGSRNYEEFLDELATCHIFLAPSVTAADGETEGGAPTVLIEAQAAGKPILTTEHADIPEVVRPGESAILVAEGNVPALGEALIALLRTPERWHSMALAGRRHVEAEHEIGRQMGKLEALYDELRSRS